MATMLTEMILFLSGLESWKMIKVDVIQNVIPNPSPINVLLNKLPSGHSMKTYRSDSKLVWAKLGMNPNSLSNSLTPSVGSFSWQPTGGKQQNDPIIRREKIFLDDANDD